MYLKKEYVNSQTLGLVSLLSSTMNLDSHQQTFHDYEEQSDKINIVTAAREVEEEMASKNRFNRFMSSIFYFLLNQSELICYFFLILNHLQSASLLSAPLPISVFLWAMLCIPRPTKTYWITSITYIEAVVVIKYLFQFKIFPWNQTSTNAAINETLLKIVALISIERKETNFAIFDLFSLLVIFLHRTILQRNESPVSKKTDISSYKVESNLFLL